MKRALCLIVLGFGLSAMNGCSSSDSKSASDPVAACKSLANTLCSKFYGCFSSDELKAASDFVGNNEADCDTKWQDDLTCTTEGTKCDSGKTYDSGKAQECLDQFKSFSCSEIKGFATGTTSQPAACSQICK